MTVTLLVSIYLALMSFCFARVHYYDKRDSIMAELNAREIESVEVNFPDGFTFKTDKAGAFDPIVAIQMGDWKGTTKEGRG